MANSTETLDLTLEALWVVRATNGDRYCTLRVGPAGLVFALKDERAEVWPIELVRHEPVGSDEAWRCEVFPEARDYGYGVTKFQCAKNYLGVIQGSMETVFDGWDLDPLSATLLTGLAEDWFSSLDHASPPPRGPHIADRRMVGCIKECLLALDAMLMGSKA